METIDFFNVIIMPSGIVLGGKYPAMIVLAVSLAVVIAAYFLGNISPAILIGKMHGIDIKKEGSGNAGTTNVLRVLGKKAAVETLLIDIFKGVFAVLIGRIAGNFLVPAITGDIKYGDILAMYCVFFVVIGHIWPVVFKFKGGKGVATAFGALTALNPCIGFSALAVVGIVVILTRRVSAGSVCGAIALPFIALYFMPEFVYIGAVTALIVLIKHRANIIRLLKGQEPKLNFKK